MPEEGLPRSDVWGRRVLLALGVLLLVAVTGIVAVLVVVAITTAGGDGDRADPVGAATTIVPLPPVASNGTSGGASPSTGGLGLPASPGPGAPSGAVGPTVKQFCAAYAVIARRDSGSDVASAKDAARRLAAIGTPAGISATGREGYELDIATIDSLSPTATAAQAAKVFADLDKTQQAKLTAFGTFIVQVCPDALTTPSASPSASPTRRR